MPQDTTVEIVEEFKPFLLHLQASVGEYPEYIADEDLLWSYTGLAHYYYGQGLYAIAEPYYQACLTATRTRLGDNHPHVAAAILILKRFCAVSAIPRFVTNCKLLLL